MRRQRLAPLLLLAASASGSDRLFAATFPGHSEATFSKVLAASGDAELAHRGQYDVTVLLAVVRRALRAQIRPRARRDAPLTCAGEQPRLARPGGGAPRPWKQRE